MTSEGSCGSQLRRSVVTAGFLGVGVMLGITAASEADEPPEAAATTLECPAPSPESIEIVTDLFENPRKPEYKSDDIWGKRYEHNDFIQQERKRLGIIYPQFDDYRETDLSIPLYAAVTPKPYGEYHYFTSSILSQLDVQLVTELPPEQMPPGAKAPTSQELETDGAKYQVLELARMFGHQSTNFTKWLGVRKVALLAHTGYSGSAIPEDGILIIDVTNAGEGGHGIPRHELTHIINPKLCGAGSTYNDPAYAGLNSQATYTGVWPPPEGFLDTMPPSVVDIHDEYMVLSAERYAAIENDDDEAYCAAETAIDGLLADIEMTTPYSYNNVEEDKADLGREILDPDGYDEMLDPAAPVRRAKFLLQAARHYEATPEVVEDWGLGSSGLYEPAYDCGPVTK